jgi:hypothetical protein
MKKPRKRRGAKPVALVVPPVLYVGSYLALVSPTCNVYSLRDGGSVTLIVENYRYCGGFAEWFYSPLERIDRTVRPVAWEW